MNGLSWLIYLADVSDNIDWLLSAVTVLSLIWLICSAACGCVMGGDGASEGAWKMWRRSVFWGFVVLPVAVLLGSIVPSKETVYAIAASEMGEKAINTQTGGKAVQALNSWLDRQIAAKSAPEKKEEK